MNEHELNDRLREAGRTELPADIESRLLAALPTQILPVKALPGIAGRTAVTLILLIVAGVGCGFLAGGKGWRTLEPEQGLALSLVLLTLAVWLAWELALRMVPAARVTSNGAPAALLALAAAAGWAVWWTPIRADSRLFYAICLAYTSGGAAFGYWLTRRWLRRGFWTNTAFSWPIAGAAGLAGFTAVQLFCPFVDVGHILTSHVLPALVAGLVAAKIHYAGVGEKLDGR